MKTVFMNHRIKQRRPRLGVIRVRGEDGEFVDGNLFRLMHQGETIGYVRFKNAGNPEIETHTVRAWVELDESVCVYLEG